MTPHEERIGDAALERELEQLLSVEPSAEFQARIRSRVAADAIETRGFGWRWAYLMGAAVVVAFVSLMVAQLNRERPVVQAVSQPGSVPPEVRPPSVPVPDVQAQVERATGEGRQVEERRPVPAIVVADAAPAVPPATHDAFSDVMVSANELKALRQVEMLLAGKQLKEEKAPQMAAVQDDMTALAIAPITIEPIQIAAIKGDAE